MPSKNPRPVADHEFDTLSSETVYLGKILALRLDEVAMPGGGTARREVVEHFGAVAVVAYHPIVTPVLIYERFGAYGLKYARPIAVLFIGVCLILFVAVRLLARRQTDVAR